MIQILQIIIVGFLHSGTSKALDGIDSKDDTDPDYCEEFSDEDTSEDDPISDKDTPGNEDLSDDEDSVVSISSSDKEM